MHYCYMTTIKSENDTYYYFGKHTGFIDDGYVGSGKFVEDAKASGKCSFNIEALCYFETSELAFEFEELLVENAMSEITKCVNMKPGGIGGYAPPTPERLEEQSKEVTERWQDPEYKERVSNSIKKSWENEEHREMMRRIHKEYNANPEVREAKSKKNKEYYSIENYSKFAKNPTYVLYDEFHELWIKEGRPSYSKFWRKCCELGYPYTINNFRPLVDRFKRAYESGEVNKK